MSKRLVALIAFSTLSTIAVAQSSIDGKWQTRAAGTRGPDIVVMEFTVDGAKLTGTITRTDPPGQVPVKLEGKVEKDTLSFTVTSPDGDRRVTFTGKVLGGEIVFAREVTGTGPPTGTGIYGLNGPKTVTAQRLK